MMLILLTIGFFQYYLLLPQVHFDTAKNVDKISIFFSRQTAIKKVAAGRRGSCTIHSLPAYPSWNTLGWEQVFSGWNRKYFHSPEYFPAGTIRPTWAWGSLNNLLPDGLHKWLDGKATVTRRPVDGHPIWSRWYFLSADKHQTTTSLYSNRLLSIVHWFLSHCNISCAVYQLASKSCEGTFSHFVA